MHYIIQGFVLFIDAFPREPYKSSRKFRERLNSIFTPVKCEANFTNYPVVSDHVRKSAKFGLLDILKCGILGEKQKIAMKMTNFTPDLKNSNWGIFSYTACLIIGKNLFIWTKPLFQHRFKNPEWKFPVESAIFTGSLPRKIKDVVSDTTAIEV